jgi:hypothetical protein
MRASTFKYAKSSPSPLCGSQVQINLGKVYRFGGVDSDSDSGGNAKENNEEDTVGVPRW